MTDAHQLVQVDGEGPVEDWVQVTAVKGEVVTFESPTIFHADGERVDSTGTLRLRGEGALGSSLQQAGFSAVGIQDLPYAPGRAGSSWHEPDTRAEHATTGGVTA